MRDNSRQTDLNYGTSGLAFLPRRPPLSVTAKPRFESFRTAMSLARTISPCGRHRPPGRPLSLRRPRRAVGGGLIEFAVERGAADLEPARDFRHLAAIMRDRKTDDLVFHVIERPHLAGGVQHHSVCRSERHRRRLRNQAGGRARRSAVLRQLAVRYGGLRTCGKSARPQVARS